jgi:hypothetical protein
MGAEDWEAIFDEGTQQYYYFNKVTNETSWSNPNEVVASTSTNWEKILDEGSGKYYYFNSSTNETTWDPPAGFGDVTAEPETTTTDVAAATTDEILPTGWTKHFDSSSQQYYYFHAESNTTSWDKPALPETTELESTVVTESVTPKEATQKLELVTDWIEHFDATSNKVYYENVKTKQTQWDSPYPANTGQSELTSLISILFDQSLRPP